MADMTSLIVGLVILGVVILLLMILNILGFVWIIGKLRQHEHDILRLLDIENMAIKHHRGDYIRLPDKDIDLNISRALMANGRNNGGNRLNARDSRARASIKIKKEEANIYGCAAKIGQVMMTAQHYCKVATNSSSDVPVESVKIVDKVSSRMSEVSRVLTEDWKEGAPTSLLLGGNTQRFDDLISQNKGVFVHKTIGPKGGNLQVSGVSLVIPPNALEDETLISLGEVWDSRFIPRLSKKQSLLSPVVLCQPSGLKFKLPVTLTFSHAAVNAASDWMPKLLKREGDLNEENDWVPLALPDYEAIDISNSNVTVKLHHFTLYTCTGESRPGKQAAKLVHIVAFAGKLQKGSFYKPRLYCINKYNDELEEVEKLATRIDANSKIMETTNLIIHDNDQDVMVELALLTGEWRLAGASTEVLPFEQIWHAFTPHCTFVMKPKTSTVSELFCEIEAYQNGAENNSAKLKIAETMSLSCQGDDPRDELINELVILLDPQNEASLNAGDYRNLAEKMKCCLASIRWLGIQSSPTRILIEKWLDEGNTFNDLEQIMMDINRADAAEEIRKRMPYLELFYKL